MTPKMILFLLLSLILGISGGIEILFTPIQIENCDTISGIMILLSGIILLAIHSIKQSQTK